METLNEKQIHKKSHEHSARLKNPGKFESFTTGEDKGGKGVNFIYGIRKDAGPQGGKTEIQAVRFDSNLWTVDAAKKWLSDHDKKYIKFTAATIKEDGAPAAPAVPAAPASTGPAITTSNMGAKYAPKVLPMTSHYGDYPVDRYDQSFMRKMKQSLGESVIVEEKDVEAKEVLNKYFSSDIVPKDITDKFVFEHRSIGWDKPEEIDKYLKKLKDEGFTIKKKSYSDFIAIGGVKRKSGEPVVTEEDELPVNAPKSEPAINPDGTPADVDAKGKDLIVPRDTDVALFDDYVKIYNATKPEERATNEKLIELAESIIKKYFGEKKVQWGSDGIEVMDDQLIFKNFSSSEDVSVDEAYRPLERTERILYGTRKGQPDYTEEIITTDPSKFKAAKEWAKKQGFDRFREASIDMMKVPDFSKTIRNEGVYHKAMTSSPAVSEGRKSVFKEYDVVEDEDGKKFRIYNISPNWAALIPVDTGDKEYSASDKRMIPIGDLHEFYRKVSK